MGNPAPYQPHKLILGILAGHTVSLSSIVEELGTVFGPIDAISPIIPFLYTDYYNPEMGEGIQRQIVSVEELVNPGTLAALKERSNKLEDHHASSTGDRSVNIDPGVLSLSRLILATTKPASHRIPIGNDMHGEVTLLYRRGEYTTLDWTYPDYASDTIRLWLKSVRTRYHQQLKDIDPGRAWRL